MPHISQYIHYIPNFQLILWIQYVPQSDDDHELELNNSALPLVKHDDYVKDNKRCVCIYIVVMKRLSIFGRFGHACTYLGDSLKTLGRLAHNCTLSFFSILIMK